VLGVTSALYVWGDAHAVVAEFADATARGLCPVASVPLGSGCALTVSGAAGRRAHQAPIVDRPERRKTAAALGTQHRDGARDHADQPPRTCRPTTVRKIGDVEGIGIPATTVSASGVTASKPRVGRTGAERQRHHRHRPRKKRLSGCPDGACRNARPRRRPARRTGRRRRPSVCAPGWHRRRRIRATSGTSRVGFPSGSRASPDGSADEPRAIDHRARRSPSPSCHQVHWPRRNPDRVDLSSCALHAKKSAGVGGGSLEWGEAEQRRRRDGDRGIFAPPSQARPQPRSLAGGADSPRNGVPQAWAIPQGDRSCRQGAPSAFEARSCSRKGDREGCCRPRHAQPGGPANNPRGDLRRVRWIASPGLIRSPMAE